MFRVESFTDAEWDAALVRHAEHERKQRRELHAVIGEFRQLDNGADWQRVYVDSTRVGRERHRVVVAGSLRGVLVSCDCEAHTYGKLCWHIALALFELDVWGATRSTYLAARQLAHVE